MELTPTQAWDKFIHEFYPFTDKELQNLTFTQWLRDNDITLKE